MAIGYCLTLLAAILIFAQETFQQERRNLQTSTTEVPNKSEVNPDDNGKDVATLQTSPAPLAPLEWTVQTGQAVESRRRRPGKGWGAFAPALLAASTVLPLLLTALAALAGKALMSSILALAVAGFNLFRSTQTNQNN